ncbi:RNase II stability modulator [Clostridium puniceum]|uniref:RNase II stability modulator n=1 Tax=Clostridium puniceum TaxID=29367 RepID=A0A1S8T7T3_9CLOT|nr:hypothetical protein [Clostridium puniceum]OOM73857.1 RNase II stability modulator [Clostridium puniceum]
MDIKQSKSNKEFRRQKNIRLVGSHTDITEQKLIQNELNSLAHYDMLTELPNRLSFEVKINDLINTGKNMILTKSLH